MVYAHMYEFMNKYTLKEFLQKFYPSLGDEFKNVEGVYKKEIKSSKNVITAANNFLSNISNRISDELFAAIQDWKYNFILRTVRR